MYPCLLLKVLAEYDGTRPPSSGPTEVAFPSWLKPEPSAPSASPPHENPLIKPDGAHKPLTAKILPSTRAQAECLALIFLARLWHPPGVLEEEAGSQS